MLKVLRKARLKDKEMRILMLGLDNAGKTTIVKKIMNEDVRKGEYKLNICKKSPSRHLWDVGGQKTLRTYWRNYFERTDSLVWVVDATDRLRINDCRHELAGLLLQERLAGASLLVFANKTDIEGCMTTEQIEEALQLDAIKTHKWTILLCSAMTGENLQEGLRWVVQDAREKFFMF
ncbi:MAG: ADP-ribosylation factor-like protein 2 [Vezdaea aestivalis]|nr:MAG: ADP-ribosylation factor-like protein 2 [Vezdaea aestivalis]